MAANAHTFNVELASQIGLNQAILLQHLYYWHQINHKKKHNIKDDKVWTYNTVDEFHEIFPYLTPRQISYAFTSLEKDGYIETGNYNKAGFDRTKWYTLTEKSLQLFVRSNLQNVRSIKQNVNSNEQNVDSNEQNVNTIPDSNTDSNTDNNTYSDATRQDGKKKPDIEILLDKIIERYPGSINSRGPMLKALKQLDTEERKLALKNIDRYSKAWEGYHHNLRNYLGSKQFSESELSKRETKQKASNTNKELDTKNFDTNY